MSIRILAVLAALLAMTTAASANSRRVVVQVYEPRYAYYDDDDYSYGYGGPYFAAPFFGFGFNDGRGFRGRGFNRGFHRGGMGHMGRMGGHMGRGRH